MEVKTEYIKKYWPLIVREQIGDGLKEQGYHVEYDSSIDNITVDIYAEKGDDKQIIEVTLRRISKDDFLKLKSFAKEHGYKLKLAAANLGSVNADIEVEGLEDLLLNYSSSHDVCTDLAYNSYVEEVRDLSYTYVHIYDEFIEIHGNGVCDVQIEMDSEHDIDFSMAFPMSFKTYISKEDDIFVLDDEHTKIEVDTSTFYK